MGRYTAGWITVPGKGKRWRTADGEYLMQRPAGGMPGVFGSIRDAWRSADKNLGGWLPGGGTPNPATSLAKKALGVGEKPPVARLNKPTRPYQRIPGADPMDPAFGDDGQLTPNAREVMRQLGSDARVTMRIGETNPLAQIGGNFGYGFAAHANPFENEIYLPGGSMLNNLATLAHEAGHLDKSRRADGRPPLEGVLGQAINVPAAALKQATGGELSPFSQAMAPFRVLGGNITAYSDAHEEDYAEKYAHDAMKGMTGRGGSVVGGPGDARTPSAYSSNLHSDGNYAIREGLVDMAVPPLAKGALMAADSAMRAMGSRPGAGRPQRPTMGREKLKMLWVESDLDLKQEMKENPNSRLIPRLKQIRDSYAKQLEEAR